MNLERYIQMLKYELHYHWKSYFHLLGISWIVLMILQLFVYITSNDASQYNRVSVQFYDIFAFYLFIFCGIIIYKSFASLAKVPSTIRYLSLPASHLEKYFAAFTWIVLILPLLTFINFYLYSIISQLIFNSALFSEYFEFKDVVLFSNWFIYPYLLVLLFLSFFMIARLSFRKRPFIKVFLAALMLFILGIGLLALGFRVLNPSLYEGLFAMKNVTIHNDKPMQIGGLNTETLLFNISLICGFFISIATGILKLKERTIA